jgi:hypothetical protein
MDAYADDPQREPVRAEHRLDVAAVTVGLARIPQVNDLALDAEGRLFALVGGDDDTIQGHVEQRLAQASGPSSASTTITSSRWVVRSRNYRKPITACRK